MSSIQSEVFGKLPDGSAVKRYTLRNKNGLVAKVMDYGAILTELWVPDRNGTLGNVVTGFDNLAQYLAGQPFFGATTGRFANRIAKGKFTLEGREYTLATNNGPNALHGGVKGFDKQLWKSEPAQDGKQSVRFTYLSKDGEEGYPGNMDIIVDYALTKGITALNQVRLANYVAHIFRPSLTNLVKVINAIRLKLNRDLRILGRRVLELTEGFRG